MVDYAHPQLAWIKISSVTDKSNEKPDPDVKETVRNSKVVYCQSTRLA